MSTSRGRIEPLQLGLDMPESDPTVQWLLHGDAAIRWQVLRDLVGASEPVVAREQHRVATTGWGETLLSHQDPSGSWAGGLYLPKWTSATYTMLLLRSLGLPPQNSQARKGCAFLLDHGFFRDGGFKCLVSNKHSETCATGMVLSVVAYFRFSDPRVHRLAEYLLDRQMAAGIVGRTGATPTVRFTRRFRFWRAFSSTSDSVRPRRRRFVERRQEGASFFSFTTCFARTGPEKWSIRR